MRTPNWRIFLFLKLSYKFNTLTGHGTMTIKVISEYARQFQWPDITPVIQAEEFVAGVPSYAEHITAEPALKTKSKATLELVREGKVKSLKSS